MGSREKRLLAEWLHTVHVLRRKTALLALEQYIVDNLFGEALLLQREVYHPHTDALTEELTPVRLRPARPIHLPLNSLNDEWR
uniref:Uncharacterized protein n=1 Tax=Anopheles quadriannulatus TaxID=34691 RepID=A0A182WXH1_ANOQN